MAVLIIFIFLACCVIEMLLLLASSCVLYNHEEESEFGQFVNKSLGNMAPVLLVSYIVSIIAQLFL